MRSARARSPMASMSDVETCLIQRKPLKSFRMGMVRPDKLSAEAASAGVWKRKVIANSHRVLFFSGSVLRGKCVRSFNSVALPRARNAHCLHFKDEETEGKGLQGYTL